MIHNKLIMALVSIALGIALVIFRGSAVAVIIRITGVVLLIAAVVYILSYFFGKKNKGEQSAIASGCLCGLFSVVCIISPGWLIIAFPIIVGIIMIISSVFNLAAAFQSHGAAGMGMTVAAALLSVLAIIFGFIAILNPVSMAAVLILFIGITLLINGVGDLITIAVMKK